MFASQPHDGERPTVICATVVKNEAWVLRQFLEAASEWADTIIVGDNGSDDDSVEIAKQFSKARVIDVGTKFDEFERRRLIINEARTIPLPRLIVAIDADEMLSATWRTSPEWARMLSSPAGTRFLFDWVFPLPGLRDSIVGRNQLFAFMDDDSSYIAPAIHAPRIPPNPNLNCSIKSIKVLHFAYVDTEQLLAKHRLYKCIELIDHKSQPVDLSTRYQGRTFSTYGERIEQVLPSWLEGLPLPKVPASTNGDYWFDDRVLELFAEYGVDRFRRVDIWNKDWAAFASRRGQPLVHDPRNLLDRAIHELLARNNDWLHYPKSRSQRVMRKLAKVAARPFGW